MSERDTYTLVYRRNDRRPFFLLSVLRKRYDSVPVSMMCAWSVRRSNMALHNLAFGSWSTPKTADSL